MCTIVLAWQVFDDPVVLAANRDEAADRPSRPPARREWGRPVVAPLDDRAAGTWIGYNDAGLVACVTNRWTDARPDTTRSRGLIVRDVLGEDSVAAARETVARAVETDVYDGFNLLLADARTATVCAWDGELATRTLEPGVHVVVNVGFDGAYEVPEARATAGRRQRANAESVREALAVRSDERGDADAWLDRAAAVLGEHDYGVCVHGDDGAAGPPPGFGTQSSSLIVVGPDSRSWRFADGAPCSTAYRPVESQV